MSGVQSYTAEISTTAVETAVRSVKDISKHMDTQYQFFCPRIGNTKIAQANGFVLITKRSQHNSARLWRTVRKWWSGGEVREGIYSILIVWELQARPFNTSNSTSKWNNFADSALFRWLNCLGDSGGQKLKKYMSAGKEKLSGRSSALSGISLCLAGT